MTIPLDVTRTGSTVLGGGAGLDRGSNGLVNVMIHMN